MFKVIQFRAGAPDKFRQFTSGEYVLVKLNNKNLVDLSLDDLKRVDDHTYFLSTSELDIPYAATLPKHIQKRCMLPQTAKGIIDYEKFVPKDSQFYQNLENVTGFFYGLKQVYHPSEFCFIYDNLRYDDKYALKVTKGTGGSRGVVVINSSRIPQGGAREQYQTLTKALVDSVIEVANEYSANIMVQKLSYPNLIDYRKFCAEYILRNGKLVVYKWEEPVGDSTNYDHLTIIRNEFTDEWINKLVNYMLSLGITDGIFGIDGYTDYHDFCSICEQNWRQENCLFEFEALGLDFIEMYLHPEVDWLSKVPYGEHKVIRYWRAAIFDINNDKEWESQFHEQY